MRTSTCIRRLMPITVVSGRVQKILYKDIGESYVHGHKITLGSTDLCTCDAQFSETNRNKVSCKHEPLLAALASSLSSCFRLLFFWKNLTPLLVLLSHTTTLQLGILGHVLGFVRTASWGGSVFSEPKLRTHISVTWRWKGFIVTSSTIYPHAHTHTHVFILVSVKGLITDADAVNDNNNICEHLLRKIKTGLGTED